MSQTIQTIYVVDDEPAALRSAKNYIKRIPDLVEMGYESNPIAARDYLLGLEKLPDILVLDIGMTPIDGLELAKIFMGKVKIIFTTAHEQYALRSYEVRAVDYLLKAFDFKRFAEAIQKCREFSLKGIEGLSRKRFTMFKDSNTHAQVNVDKSSILYIESFGNYTKMYMENGSPLMPHMSLKAVMEQLDDIAFVRIQKSFAVNIWKVRTYWLDQVELSNGNLIKIGRLYKTKVKEHIDKLHKNS